MISFGSTVSHRWRRAQYIKQIREGRVSRAEACEGDFLLQTTAKFHGRAVAGVCPVCERDGVLREVWWVFGDAVGSRAYSARSEAELEALVAQTGSAEVHTVEVCTACGWNFLLMVQEATCR